MWADMPTFDVQEFDLASDEGCTQFRVALEANDDDDSRLDAALQLHHKLCDSMTKPLKVSQRFVQCLTEVITCLCVPPELIVQSKAFQLSMDQDGSRLVQAALQVGDRKVQAAIVSELQGHVCEMVGSPHANHVLQRIIELLPPATVGFMLEEIASRWSPDFVAKHKFGCRVLERMIEHFPCAPQVFPLWAQFLDGLLQNAATHSYHAFSTFIMQHLMEHGTEHHRQIIVQSVIQDLESAALDSHASGVLDKALCFLQPNEQFLLASKILEIDGLLPRMISSNRSAAERLLRIVNGALMAEAQRQLTVAYPDATTRSKALKPIFGNKIPLFEDKCDEFNFPGQSQTMGVQVLVAPAPMSMVPARSEANNPMLTIPQQQCMAPSEWQHCQSNEEEKFWWDATVSQVFSLWTSDPQGSWPSQSANADW